MTLRRLGFNLIELILVVTVFVGLGALLLPIIYRAITHSQVAQCSANLELIGTWTATYTSSNDGYLPAYEKGWVARIADAGSVRMDQGAQPKETFACPSQKHVSLQEGVTANAWWRGTNYGINQHMASNLVKEDDGQPLGHWAQANIKKIRSAGGKLLYADATGGNVMNITRRDPVVAGISVGGRTFADSIPPKPAIGTPYMRHVDGQGNFLFLDQHVETLGAWPSFMLGRGTKGFDFWHAEHWYPDLGIPNPEALQEDPRKQQPPQPEK